MSEQSSRDRPEGRIDSRPGYESCHMGWGGILDGACIDIASTDREQTITQLGGGLKVSRLSDHPRKGAALYSIVRVRPYRRTGGREDTHSFPQLELGPIFIPYHLHFHVLHIEDSPLQRSTKKKVPSTCCRAPKKSQDLRNPVCWKKVSTIESIQLHTGKARLV